MGRLKKAAFRLATVGAGVYVAGRIARERNRIDFAGRVVVITGGSRGLGLLMARRFGAEGARLALLARDEEELQRAEQELTAGGTEVLSVPCDVRDQNSVQDAMGRVLEHYGQIDVLINNVGIIQVGPVEHMQLEDFQAAVDTHLWASLYTTLAVLPHMRERGAGRIANIASIGGKFALPHMTPYTASKFAQVGLSDALRAELAKDGILVTTVIPFVMRTGSHLNASFKGQQELEFTLFALFGALPPNSVDGAAAARSIVEACRYGDPELVVGLQARALILANALFPNLVAKATALMGRFMPRPTGAEGDQTKSGWESRSPLAPSSVTRLADRATVENNELRGHQPPA